MAEDQFALIPLPTPGSECKSMARREAKMEQFALPTQRPFELTFSGYSFFW